MCQDVNYYYTILNVESTKVEENWVKKCQWSTKLSNACKFNFMSDARIQSLKTVTLKKRTESKMNWGVKAYNEWREERLLKFNYDVGIYEANLNDLASLKLENFQHAMCYFIPEVTKSKGEGLYPGRTLYQMVVSIQKYLNINKIPWKIIEGPEFNDLKTVLDNVMKERTAMNLGVKKKQAEFIPYSYESEMWEQGILGEDSPDRLRDTVLFLIGRQCALRASDEHYYLRRPTPTEPSQLSFELNPSGLKCLVYREDTISKTHDGGLKDMRSDRKEVWVYPNDNPTRCCVRLVDKYLKLCPKNVKKPNFYLQSLAKPRPSQWYGDQVVGQNTLAKTVKNLLKEANIDGYFTNHSCRRSSTTKLFQAGIDKKIIKEVTGHRSDAVDSYAITSDKQREAISKIMSDEPNGKAVETVVKVPNVTQTEKSEGNTKVKSCTCGATGTVTSKNIGFLVDSIMSKVDEKCKTVIKFEIEITKE